MAVTVINDKYRHGGPAAEQFGNTLGNGLSQLANLKTQQLQQRHQRGLSEKGFESLNLPKAIANLPQGVQESLVKNWAEEGGLQRVLQELNKNNPEGQQQPFNPQEQQAQQQQVPGQPQQQQRPGITKDQLMQQNEQMQSMEPWQILQNKPFGKTQLALYKEAHKQQREINNQINPQLQALDKAAHAVQKDKGTNKAIRDAIDSGKLTKAEIARAQHQYSKNAEKIESGKGKWIGGLAGGALGLLLGGPGGLAAGAYLGKDIGEGIGQSQGAQVPKFVGSDLDQAFTKMVLGKLKNAKDYFGSSPALGEIEILLDTFPTLYMDDNAKRALVDQIEAIDNLVLKEYEVKNNLMKKYGNNPPADLFAQIHEATQGQVDETANNIVQTIQKLISNQPKGKANNGLSLNDAFNAL